MSTTPTLTASNLPPKADDLPDAWKDYGQSTDAFSRAQPADDCFEFGLVLAGAVSGGAYSAGVLDFLVEALDAWQSAKAAGEDVPKHRVLLQAMTGASAGSMCAAILGAMTDRTFPPIRNASTLQVPPDPQKPAQSTGNPLFDAWVGGIDMLDLIDPDDLTGGKDARPRSLLSGIPLDQLAANVFNPSDAVNPNIGRRAWIADPLHVGFTATSLRGAAYDLSMLSNRPGGGQVYASHREVLRFAIGQRGYPDEVLLSQPCAIPPAGSPWGEYRDAALASGAFPGALPPRAISRTSASVDRIIYLGYWPEINGSHHFCRIRGTNPDESRNFVAVDGGCLNNEPLELCRTLLAGLAGRNPRDAASSHRAVVMIDPFLENPVDGAFAAWRDGDDSFLSSILRLLLTAYKNDARCRIEDLALASHAEVYSRFLIAPSRGLTTGLTSGRDLASGALDAFSGFLCRPFRVHDFMLGRRNCQQFLRRHFCLPSGHKLFIGGTWTDEQKHDQRYVHTDDGNTFLPIIPLVQRAGVDLGAELPMPAWPKGAFTRAHHEVLRGRIIDRLEHLYPKLKAMIGLSGAVGWVASNYYPESKLADLVLKHIKGGIQNHGLAD